jgi:hypothetical protein
MTGRDLQGHVVQPSSASRRCLAIRFEACAHQTEEGSRLGGGPITVGSIAVPAAMTEERVPCARGATAAIDGEPALGNGLPWVGTGR